MLSEVTNISLHLSGNQAWLLTWQELYERDNLIVAMDDHLMLTQIQVISELYKLTTCTMTKENDGIYLQNVILVRYPKDSK